MRIQKSTTVVRIMRIIILILAHQILAKIKGMGGWGGGG